MRRALVIGAEGDGLGGVRNDVDTMTELLAHRGFTLDRRMKENATRAGILDGFEQLLSNATDGDAVVIYYSGHGGMAEVKAPNGLSLPDLQIIVPTDFADSRPGDFRGITAVELSVLLARLTERTRNVVLILDCCHAAHMARELVPPGDDFVVRLVKPSYLDVAEHIGMLRAQGLQTNLLHPISNPYLVRVVACGPWGLAYEYTNQDGIRVGLATDSLRIALEGVGTARVTWAALAQRIRFRVSTLASGQRPEAEGPARRLLFEIEEVPGGARFSVVRELPARLSLLGAALLGLRAGDRLAVTAAGVDVADDSTTVAQAMVSRTDGVNAQATFELRPGHQDLPQVAEAHPLSTSQSRYPVSVNGDGPLAEQLRSAIAGESTLYEIGPTDPSADRLADSRAGSPDGDPVGPEVRVDDGLALWDGGTVPLSTATADPAGICRIRADLVRLARTAQLRRLGPDAGDELTDQFTIEWGQVVAGDAQPLPPSGAQLHAGTPIYLRLRNDSDRDLFFFVFDMGVAGAVTLITAADPSGLRLAPRQQYVVGERNGALEGMPLIWPAGVPTADPRPETVLMIITSAPQDLSVLAIGGTGTTRGSWSLEQALAAVGAGGRDSSPAEKPRARYAVVRLDWYLSAE